MPPHPYSEDTIDTWCATCGEPTSTGIPLAQIETPTTSAHADLFRFGTRHVCPACAWLFAAGKGKPGNYMAVGDKYESLVISIDSVVTDKLPWRDALRKTAVMPPDTAIAGLMTTDVKPRLWPRVKLASVGHFGLYIHCPDYDVSEWRFFDLQECIALIDEIEEVLAIGFAKASAYYGLTRDYARTIRSPEKTLALESRLATQRQSPHFLPALIAAGVNRKEKAKNDQPITAVAGNDVPGTARSHPVDQTQLGLF